LKTLVVTGDVGGAKCVFTCLQKLQESSEVYVVENGFISTQKSKLKNINWIEGSFDSVVDFLDKEEINNLLFSTSVHDKLALRIARVCKELGIKTYCLLDNWMNYRYRLEMDGEGLFSPTKYLVMDKIAFDESVKEGISKDILEVVGQPCLSNMSEYLKNKVKDGKKESRLEKRIGFVCEPVENDQGRDSQNPNFRGYTEFDVLNHLFNFFEKVPDVKVLILAHPRNELEKLKDYVKKNSKGVRNEIVQNMDSLSLLLNCDGVVGMSSILLYQSWLLGKNVISLQPGLVSDKFNFLENFNGIMCNKTAESISIDLGIWMKRLNEGDNLPQIELIGQHERAIQNILEVIKNSDL
tara:strand:- start:154498 stop:155556 length:1059 start_codon:yes stop_codon:yes gene_type:complete